MVYNEVSYPATMLPSNVIGRRTWKYASYWMLCTLFFMAAAAYGSYLMAKAETAALRLAPAYVIFLIVIAQAEIYSLTKIYAECAKWRKIVFSLELPVSIAIRGNTIVLVAPMLLAPVDDAEAEKTEANEPLFMKYGFPLDRKTVIFKGLGSGQIRLWGHPRLWVGPQKGWEEDWEIQLAEKEQTRFTLRLDRKRYKEVKRRIRSALDVAGGV